MAHRPPQPAANVYRRDTRAGPRFLFGSDMLRPHRLAYGLAPVIEVLESHGKALAPLLAAADIPRFALEEPSFRIRVDQELRFIREALSALKLPEAGLLVGQRYTLALFGVLGLAASCAPTMRELFRMVPTFPDLAWGAIGLSVWRMKGSEFAAFHPTPEVGDLAAFFVERDTAATLALFRQNCGAGLAPLRVRFRHPAPRNSAAYSAWFGCEVTFEDAANEIHFPPAIWERVPPQANGMSYRFYANQCRRLSQLLREPLSYADVVRGRLRAETPIPTLEQLLQALHLSKRTLQRRLDAEGTSFSLLHAEVRLERARELMRFGGMGQDDIARQLGFSDASAFSRAFKAWTGRSPRGFRRDLL
ncbi:MAG: AraC family transcriptional regulator [Gammaproteobacteria bacterium]|nr:AraC family transcriptional regulator [Gammaproteobacteria bacterium]